MLIAIEAALSAMEHIGRLLANLLPIARQTGELTAEKEAEYAARQEKAFASAAWQPEKNGD